MQLITLTEDISFALDNHKQTDIILLDFSKAFDTVPHQRLNQTKIAIMELLVELIIESKPDLLVS